jgi:hypothetical protein
MAPCHEFEGLRRDSFGYIIMLYSVALLFNLFCSLTPLDVISLRLCTPEVVG